MTCTISATFKKSHCGLAVPLKRMPVTVTFSADFVGTGLHRSRFNRSAYSFSALGTKLDSDRVQLETVYGIKNMQLVMDAFNRLVGIVALIEFHPEIWVETLDGCGPLSLVERGDYYIVTSHVKAESSPSFH